MNSVGGGHRTKPLKFVLYMTEKKKVILLIYWNSFLLLLHEELYGFLLFEIY